MNHKKQVLVVDDDEELGDLLTRYLAPYDLCVHVALTGGDMRAMINQRPIDLIIMDVMLPINDGISLTRELRQHSRLPIIMLSARADHFDRVLGLESGADDYVSKPFEPRELVARIHALLRRATATSLTSWGETSSIAHFDGWSFDLEGHSLRTPTGQNVTLSNAELRLLSAFARSPQKILGRDQLRLAVSGYNEGQSERSIDLLVSRLRQKLALCVQGGDMIKTVRGRGYLLDSRPTGPAASVLATESNLRAQA